MAIQHSAITDPNIHEPKGVASATAGTVYVADGAGSGTWQDPIPSDINRIGWANYHDYVTSIGALAVSSTTWTKLTNDALGSKTTEAYLPSGVTSLWDASNNQLDFSELVVGAMVDIRVDISVTTSAANQYVDARLFLGVGDPDAYEVNLGNRIFKTAGTYELDFYTGIPMLDSVTIDNPGEVKIYSDATLTVVIKTFYTKVTKASN